DVDDDIIQKSERRIDRVGCHRKGSSPLQLAKEARLDPVNQAAFGERVKPVERMRLLCRLEAVDRSEEKLIGAQRESLQRRERVRASPKTCGGQRITSSIGDPQEAIELRPLPLRTGPTVGQRSPKRSVLLEDVLRMTAHRFRIASIQQGAKNRKVM